MIRNSLICKLINVQASMKENNEKKMKNEDEISKLIKAFPKDIAALDKRSVLAKVNSQGSLRKDCEKMVGVSDGKRKGTIGSPFWNRMPVTGSQSVPCFLFLGLYRSSLSLFLARARKGTVNR